MDASRVPHRDDVPLAARGGEGRDGLPRLGDESADEPVLPPRPGGDRPVPRADRRGGDAPQRRAGRDHREAVGRRREGLRDAPRDDLRRRVALQPRLLPRAPRTPRRGRGDPRPCGRRRATSTPRRRRPTPTSRRCGTAPSSRRCSRRWRPRRAPGSSRPTASRPASAGPARPSPCAPPATRSRPVPLVRRPRVHGRVGQRRAGGPRRARGRGEGRRDEPGRHLLLPRERRRAGEDARAAFRGRRRSPPGRGTQGRGAVGGRRRPERDRAAGQGRRARRDARHRRFRVEGRQEQDPPRRPRRAPDVARRRLRARRPDEALRADPPRRRGRVGDGLRALRRAVQVPRPVDPRALRGRVLARRGLLPEPRRPLSDVRRRRPALPSVRPLRHRHADAPRGRPHRHGVAAGGRRTRRRAPASTASSSSSTACPSRPRSPANPWPSTRRPWTTATTTYASSRSKPARSARARIHGGDAHRRRTASARWPSRRRRPSAGPTRSP